jgi:hypothetical protein
MCCAIFGIVFCKMLIAQQLERSCVNYQVYATVNTCLVWTATLCFVPMVVFGAVATLLASAIVHYVMSGYDFAPGDPSSSAAPTVLSAREPAPRRLVPTTTTTTTQSGIRVIAAVEPSGSESDDDGVEDVVVGAAAAGSRARGRISYGRGVGRGRLAKAWPAPSPPLSRLPKSKSTEDMVRMVLTEESFLSSLLAELPGVDASSAPIQSAINSMKQGVAGVQ